MAAEDVKLSVRCPRPHAARRRYPRPMRRRLTLGPKGRNVVIDKKFRYPTVTKDGVTVAKEIELEDPYENMGAQMVREVASEVLGTIAGDGTINRHRARGCDRQGRHRRRLLPCMMTAWTCKRGVDLAVDAIVGGPGGQTRRESTSNEEIAQVGTISANGRTARSVTSSPRPMQKVGNEGVITVEEAKSSRENRTRRGRGHAVSIRGYSLPLLHHQCRQDAARSWKTPTSSSYEKKLSGLQGTAACCSSRGAKPASRLLDRG